MSITGKAIENSFISPNVTDSNLEAANIVDVLDAGSKRIAKALHQLGNADASTPFGALEAHGGILGEKLEMISASLNDVAEAIRYAADTIAGSMRK